VAGKRYLAAGGNGETKQAIDKYAEQHPDVWQGILAVSKKAEEDNGYNS
jgi:L-rhamnose mutarotase